MRFYFGRHVTVLGDAEELRELTDKKEKYIIFEEEAYQKLNSDIKDKLKVILDDYRVQEFDVVLVKTH